MNYSPGNTKGNLETAEKFGREAIRKGAKWIVFPEFFSCGMNMGNEPEMLDAHEPPNSTTTTLLRQLAKSSGGGAAGSFLVHREKHTYNTFVLALSDGTIHTHDKDIPSVGSEIIELYRWE